MRKIIMIVLIILLVIIGGALLFIRFWPGIGKVPNKKMKESYLSRTTYFDGNTFKNANPDISVMVKGSDSNTGRLMPKDTIPVVKSARIEQGKESELNVMWIGHSSTLVQLGSTNVLIDPIFSDYCSPVQFAGPKRFSELPISMENMPAIDVVLLSHDHYDHTDYETIKKMDSKISHYVVPLGVESYLIGWGIDPAKIQNIAWYEEIQIGNIRIMSTPSQHFTARNPWKRNVSWWCGYYFRDDYHSVYYSGDGGYNDCFKEISEKVGDIDLALIECGQYGKAWPSIHMFPEEVAAAANELHASWTIPVHWATFCICNNDWDDSIQRFLAEVGQYDINIATPMIGELVHYQEIDQYQSHWWEGLD